jgi:RHS repeat-associated protein
MSERRRTRDLHSISTLKDNFMPRILGSTLSYFAKASTYPSHSLSANRRGRNRSFARLAGAVEDGLRQALSTLLVMSLLASSTPAASETIVGVGRESHATLGFWLKANPGTTKLYRTLTGQSPAGARRQEKQTDRDARVSRIEVYPGSVTVDLNEQVTFAAVAYDAGNSPVGGVKVQWRGQALNVGSRPRITPQGLFEATAPGSFSIVAEGASKSAEVTIVVRPGVKRNPNPVPTILRTISSRDVLSPVGAKADGRNESVAQRSKRKAGKTKQRGLRLRAHTPRPSAATGAGSSAAMPIPLLPDSGWDGTNYPSADDPGNRVGAPPGGPLDEGAGSGNFQMAAPVLGLPGRGIDISLGLAYNSRLWNKADSQLSFDNDRGWPGPGFSLGFGKLFGMGGGSMLIDADGTRHAFTGTVSPANSFPQDFYGHTTDGSFIDYWHRTNNVGWIIEGQAKLANGTVIHYGAHGPGGVFPDRITDPNGNYITIAYVNNAGPRIAAIVDTLGRPTNFYYDSNELLTAITAPGYNNNGVRTLVRLHYRQLNLAQHNNYGFSTTMTPVVRDLYPWVPDAIYYPGTNTGYWFGDTDSYSSYGMLAKVVEVRDMSFSGPEPVPAFQGPTEQGTITSVGQMTRKEVYNYPLYPGDPNGTPSSNLTDAPTYTSLTESWTRDGVNTDQAVTNYEVHQDANPRTVTVTMPNGTKSTQYSNNYSSLPENDPLKPLDGLVYRDETYVTSGTVLQSSTATWEKGAYESPRPTRVEATNERGQTTATEFSYETNSLYNQAIEVRNYDYNSGLLRRTTTQFQNSSSYTGRHIFNLPLVTEAFGGDGLRVSRTEYQYDGQTLTARPDVVQHDHAFNPYDQADGQCWTTPDWSDCDCTFCRGEAWGEVGDGYCSEVLLCPYDPSTNYRGNVTQVTSYANAGAEPAAGAITETRRYDITGNLVTASTSCCQQTSFNYTVDTQYGYPLSQTRGSASDSYAQVTTSATYDFNTGLLRTTTDANGRQSGTSYATTTLRPISSVAPTGAHTDYSYNDAAMTVTSTTYVAGASPIADQNIKLLNGRGQVRQEQARAPDNSGNQVWDFADVTYDNLGQVVQQSMPYRSGQTQQLSTATYDALGRTTRVTAPDGSVTETYYNEIDFDPSDSYVPQRPGVASTAAGETTLVRDAWGRERWGRADAQGRLVEVVEPSPLGSGSVSETGLLLTTYAYNPLGNLTQITQGAQTRSFKYDSLGRLLAQKLAETSATLNDAGAYQSGGGTWSDVFTYDDRSNLTSRIDARGVKTVYTYNSDPLNRLQSVSWDLSSPHENLQDSPILAAATVSYEYRTKTSGSQLRDITQPTIVTTSGISTETYEFDSEGRVFFKKLVVNGRPAMDTNYSYDNLDRVTDVDYPAKNFSAPQSSRPHVHQDYDLASRLTGLTVDGAAHASNIVYNAASQTTSLSVGASGSNQIIESYGYDQQTGLLASQTAARFSSQGNPILNLSYDYADANGKRTGQLTKILNNLNPNKDRSYTYDKLGRLTQAKGGPSTGAPIWTQTYAYDQYGNRTFVSASGTTAKAGSAAPGSAGILPATSAKREAVGSQPEALATASSAAIPQPRDPQVSLPTEQLASRTNIELPDSLRTDASRSISKSHHNSRAPGTNTAAPPASPPVFTDPDLLAPGGVIIKALHITQLRNAIDDLRIQRGGSAYLWQASLADFIKVDPIVEMRTILDLLLGPPPAPGYDPYLVQYQPILAIHIQELRNRVVANWYSSSQTPSDGHVNLSYDAATNRITTAGFAYDAAGNQVSALIAGGGSQRFQYDAANRLVNVKTDDNQTVIASYTYGDSNERLIVEEGSIRTYYACDGMMEYTESGSSTTPQWSKTYIYLGARLLSTLTPNGSGGQFIQYHHPDRLGTRLVTNAQDTTYFEQQTLPFGTALNESPPAGGTTGAINRRFTSYDRSLNTVNTGLDYAINRHYDPQQGRFTQVDPIGMSAASLGDPQSLNMYAYCGNDPVNHIDPDGLFWGKVLKWASKIIKWVGLAVLIAAAVVLTCYFAPAGSLAFKFFLWGTAKLLPFLSTYLGWTTGGLLVPTIGSPQWNPHSRSIFGNSFQGQGSTCPPDCQNEISLPPVSAGTIYANYSTLEKVLRGVGNWATGVADEVTTLPFGDLSLTKWWRHRQGWEGDADEGSTSYQVGGYTGVAFEITIEALTGEAEAKAAGWAGRIALDSPHHTFGRLGKLGHLQLNIYKRGVRGSGRVIRIPLPLRKLPKRNYVRRF